MSHKCVGAVRAEDLACPHPVGRFKKFVEIGMVGKRNRVVDTKSIFGTCIDGPAGDGKGRCSLQPGNSESFGRHRRGDHRMSGERFPVVLGKISQGDTALFINLADGMGVRMLQHGNAVIGQDPRDLLRFSEWIEVQDWRAVVGDRLLDQRDHLGDRLGSWGIRYSGCPNVDSIIRMSAFGNSQAAAVADSPSLKSPV